MNKRGLKTSKRRRTSLIVAVVISVMTLAGPASADRVEDVSDASSTHVSTSYSTTFGRSWS